MPSLSRRTALGNRHVVWNGLNKQGGTVASGVYIAEFKAGVSWLPQNDLDEIIFSFHSKAITTLDY
ncbi:MAG: hypothetical protein CM1200mP10_33230 [Candidatus Neomarinimicrobiota bacterium]|nr:MAG: hypothetical protein CM1200mP10_33230 [Candidatus Neomarinimicrobiota bacterium]